MSLARNDVYTFGPYRLDVSARELTRSGEPVQLAPKTFDLLVMLVRSEGQVLTKSHLMSTLWPDVFVEEASVAFQISTLRKALGEDGPTWIETVPKHGYRFTADVECSTGPSRKAHVTAAEPARRTNVSYLVVAAVLALAMLFVARRPDRTAARYENESRDYSAPVPLTAYPGDQQTPNLSPDGSQVAFSWNGPTRDNFDIYIKLVGPGEPLRLTKDVARDHQPAWSPDGRLVAFQRYRSDLEADIFVMPALGGAERKVAAIRLEGPDRKLVSTNAWTDNLTWTPDGKWLAIGGRLTDQEPSGIWMIAVDGPERRRLTTVASPHLGDRSPVFSSDGKNLAFIRERTLSSSSIYVLPLSNLEPAGAPQDILDHRANVLSIVWKPDVSGLLFSSSTHMGMSRMRSVRVSKTTSSSAGASELLTFGERARGITMARTGRVVYAAQFRDTNFWKFTLGSMAGPNPVVMPGSTLDEMTPDYSPDGKRLAFASTRSGAEEIWVANTDGSNPIQVTSMGGPQCSNPRWSPDGRKILFNSRRDGSSDLYLLDPETVELRRITSDPAEEFEPRWSRDGRTIYFGSNTTGEVEVWKIAAMGGAPIRVTKQGGASGMESPDGQFLYYAKDSNSPTSIWRVPVGGGYEEPVVSGLSYALNFAVGKRGLYLIAVGDSPHKTSLDYYEYATKKRTTLAHIGKRFWWGMALSPDETSLLYAVVDSDGSNLMMVDKVR
jgi:Tol biopolymer transport system component/DNA-binding winged helix-turn-helix (wHTH) protein